MPLSATDCFPHQGTRRLEEAGPSTPVRISGLRDLPRTGDELLVVGTEAKAKQVSEYRLARQSLEKQAEQDEAARVLSETAAAKLAAAKAAAAMAAMAGNVSETSRKRLGNADAAAAEAAAAEAAEAAAAEAAAAAAPKLVPAVLKAESAGALEAVHASLSQFPQDRVKLKVIRADVGAVTEADVQLAEATSSAIIGFNVGIPSKVRPMHARNACTLTLKPMHAQQDETNACTLTLKPMPA